MFPAEGSLSEKLYRRACKVMPGGSSRRSIYDMRSYVQSGNGCRMIDIDGDSWLDASNNFMVLIHGHNHAPTLDAIRGQLDHGLCFGLPTPAEVLLAEHMCQRVSSVERIVFCNSGSEAVMHAMKAARALTMRPKIAKCEGLYHGSYDFAEVSNAPKPIPGQTAAPKSEKYGPYTSPHVLEDVVVIPFNDIAGTEAIIRGQADQIAGIIIDPIPSRVGYVKADADYLRMLRRLCDEFGIILICDEVASFRAAYGGSQSLFGVEPDLTAFGKVIGGGMQIGAIAGKASAMRIFDPSDARPSISFTGTFNAHPLSMAAGLATLKDYDAAAVARLNAMGEKVRKDLRAGIARKGLPVHVEGCASFVALFFAPREAKSYHDMAHRSEELPLVHRFWSAAMDRRLFIDVTARFNLSTAYCDEDVGQLTHTVLESLDEAFNPVAYGETANAQ